MTASPFQFRPERCRPSSKGSRKSALSRRTRITRLPGWPPQEPHIAASNPRACSAPPYRPGDPRAETCAVRYRSARIGYPSRAWLGRSGSMRRSCPELSSRMSGRAAKPRERRSRPIRDAVRHIGRWPAALPTLPRGRGWKYCESARHASRRHGACGRSN